MHAEITGWGKCAPPATLTNDDLSTIMDTSDDWIYPRTGIKRRHISHVGCCELARVASERALACAGLTADDIDLIIFGSTTPDEIVPNTASLLKQKLGATTAAAFDLNSACTSFIYSLKVATDMIASGSLRRALVIGAEKCSFFIDWTRRDSAVLFGDGAGAVVVEATENETGLLAASMGCVPDTRELLQVPNWGHNFDRYNTEELHLALNFDGQEIFKHAVRNMGNACKEVLDKSGVPLGDVDLFVPHQANLRIIETLAKRLDFDMDKVVVRIQEYGNTSAASIPLALCDALEQGKVKPGMNLITATFGAGLAVGAGLIRWGQRVTPLSESDAELPPCDQSGLELIADSLAFCLKQAAKS